MAQNNSAILSIKELIAATYTGDIDGLEYSQDFLRTSTPTSTDVSTQTSTESKT